MRRFRKRSRRKLTSLRAAGRSWHAPPWLGPLNQWLRKVPQRLSDRLRRGAVIARLRKADIVLASPRTAQLSLVALLYRVLLRARYVHSMLYIGGGKVIHTTARRGVVVDRLPRAVFRRDRYTIYRARDLTPEQRDAIVGEALASLDRKLDHAALVTNIPSRWLGLRGPLLRMEKNRVWCSRLICMAFAKNGIELVPDEKSDVITSEDLSRSPVLEQM